jgi:hypothetical protein
VAADYNRESRSFGLEIQLSQIVQHIDANATQLKHSSFRQFARPRSFVDIAANGGDGSNRGKLFEDFGRADISRMNDVFAPAQSFDGLRAQQAVGVGDDAD